MFTGHLGLWACCTSENSSLCPSWSGGPRPRPLSPWWRTTQKPDWREEQWTSSKAETMALKRQLVTSFIHRSVMDSFRSCYNSPAAPSKCRDTRFSEMARTGSKPPPRNTSWGKTWTAGIKPKIKTDKNKLKIIRLLVKTCFFWCVSGTTTVWHIFVALKLSVLFSVHSLFW